MEQPADVFTFDLCFVRNYHCVRSSSSSLVVVVVLLPVLPVLLMAHWYCCYIVVAAPRCAVRWWGKPPRWCAACCAARMFVPVVPTTAQVKKTHAQRKHYYSNSTTDAPRSVAARVWTTSGVIGTPRPPIVPELVSSALHAAYSKEVTRRYGGIAQGIARRGGSIGI